MLLMAGNATEPRLPTPMAAKAHPFVGAKAKATSLVRLAHSPEFKELLVIEWSCKDHGNQTCTQVLQTKVFLAELKG